MNCTTFIAVIEYGGSNTIVTIFFQIFQYYEQKKNDETNVKKKLKNESTII